MENGSQVCQGVGTVDLEAIRRELISLEDAIILALAERAKYPRNPSLYKRERPNGVDGLGAIKASDGVHGGAVLTPNGVDGARVGVNGVGGKLPVVDGSSALDVCVRKEDSIMAELGVFPALDRCPFTHDLPQSLPQFLPNARGNLPQVNANDRILDHYIHQVLPRITSSESSERDLGRACLADAAVLRLLSNRIHGGTLVAESKFQKESQEYCNLIRAKDSEGIMHLLTNVEVEKKVFLRVRAKTEAHLPTAADQPVQKNGKVNPADYVTPDVLDWLYRTFIVPVTKDVEVEYLLQRCPPTNL